MISNQTYLSIIPYYYRQYVAYTSHNIMEFQTMVCGYLTVTVCRMDQSIILKGLKAFSQSGAGLNTSLVPITLGVSDVNCLLCSFQVIVGSAMAGGPNTSAILSIDYQKRYGHLFGEVNKQSLLYPGYVVIIFRY